ncbi:MAG: DUF3299 domain-containing protein [Blastocatellia bacterium]|nr:DUF3299 domain-containing protein [Blastocatellia bacterium]
MKHPFKKALGEKYIMLGMIVCFIAIVVVSVWQRPQSAAKSPVGMNDLQVEGGVTKVGFAYIKDAKYDFTPGKPVPPPPNTLQILDGKKVEVMGFAMPLYSPDGKTEFLLTQSANGCCFGAPPQLQHMILVRCANPNLKIEDISRPVKVQGVFSVGEEKDSYGYVTSLLRVTAETVQPAG